MQRGVAKGEGIKQGIKREKLQQSRSETMKQEKAVLTEGVSMKRHANVEEGLLEDRWQVDW